MSLSELSAMLSSTCGPNIKTPPTTHPSLFLPDSPLPAQFFAVVGHFSLESSPLKSDDANLTIAIASSIFHTIFPHRLPRRPLPTTPLSILLLSPVFMSIRHRHQGVCRPWHSPSQEGRMTCLPWNKSMMSIVGHASLLLTLEATKFKKNSWSNQQYIYLSILTKNLYNLVGKNEPLTHAICYKAISNEIQFATFSKVGKLFHSNNHNWTDQPQHPSCSFSTLTRITKSTSSCSKWASD